MTVYFNFEYILSIEKIEMLPEHPTSVRLVSLEVQVMVLASRTMLRLASMKARNFRTNSHSQCHLLTKIVEINLFCLRRFICLLYSNQVRKYSLVLVSLNNSKLFHELTFAVLSVTKIVETNFNLVLFYFVLFKKVNLSLI